MMWKDALQEEIDESAFDHNKLMMMMSLNIDFVLVGWGR